MRNILFAEKMYQQHQGMPQKSKKASPRKNSRSSRTPKAKEIEHPGGITIAHSADSDKTAEDMDKIIAEVVSTLSSEVLAPQMAPPPPQVHNKPLAQPKVKTTVINSPSTMMQRQFTVPVGSTLQNVQIATSTGLQTIQITAPTKGGGTSLLASSAKMAKTVMKKPAAAAM